MIAAVHLDQHAFPFRQQLGEMGVVDASVPSAGQVYHVGGEPLGRGVGRSATAKPMRHYTASSWSDSVATIEPGNTCAAEPPR